MEDRPVIRAVDADGGRGEGDRCDKIICRPLHVPFFWMRCECCVLTMWCWIASRRRRQGRTPRLDQFPAWPPMQMPVSVLMFARQKMPTGCRTGRAWWAETGAHSGSAGR
eukprot:16438088-Heterocapsa_arctica.AAC.1